MNTIYLKVYFLIRNEQDIIQKKESFEKMNRYGKRKVQKKSVHLSKLCFETLEVLQPTK